MNRRKILFLSAEVAPFAKRGGLADVAGSLPKALAALGHDVRVVMPAYQFIESAAAHGGNGWDLQSFAGGMLVPTSAGMLPAGVFHTVLPGSTVPIYFIAEHHLFDRPEIYGYADDAYRFSFFSRAGLELAAEILHWRPDIVHGHDWHAAPAITWLATSGQSDWRYSGTPSLFTIHNLAHQGWSSRDVLSYLGVHEPPMLEENPREVNFMARGIYHATMINAVSPTYAREIMTPHGGNGLDGLLRFRHYDVHGILNGLDYDVWNPATDPHLAARFDADHVSNRAANKAALQKMLSLPVRDDLPMVSIVSRLDRQKGCDIAGHAIHLLLNNLAGGEAQCVVLGSGAVEYEDMFARLAGYHSLKMRMIAGYNPDLAPLIYGGSDIFLMPSLFEPCGLGQMIAMRYGCVPIVRATGGLADTVQDGVTGFSFYNYTPEDLFNSIAGALYIYRNDRDLWHAVQRNGMQADFSWSKSALGYQQLYEWAIARLHGV